jgi:hypothetical protein
MNIGFTGTQHGMTEAQKVEFATLLYDLPGGRVLHGGCIGADEDADRIANDLGFITHVYPGVTTKGEALKRGMFKAARVFPEKFYLTRNRDIVKNCDMLIATPDGPERLRSGTWSTVRLAKSLGKPGWIIHPNGSKTSLDVWESTLDSGR